MRNCVSRSPTARRAAPESVLDALKCLRLGYNLSFRIQWPQVVLLLQASDITQTAARVDAADGPVNLRWILGRTFEKIARHAGDADILRERRASHARIVTARLPQSQRLAPTPGLAATREQIAQLHVASTVLPQSGWYQHQAAKQVADCAYWPTAPRCEPPADRYRMCAAAHTCPSVAGTETPAH